MLYTVFRVAAAAAFTLGRLAGRGLRERFSEHLPSIRNRSPGFPIAEQLNSPELSVDDIMVCGLKQCTGNNTCHKQQEMELIFTLGTISPNGLKARTRCIIARNFCVTKLCTMLQMIDTR